ncbi:MAG: hypothetical protein ABH952_00615 [Candidatus Omnitrophota bacterium]
MKIDYTHIPRQDLPSKEDAEQAWQSLEAKIAEMNDLQSRGEKLPDNLMIGWKQWPNMMLNELNVTLAMSRKLQAQGLTDVIFIGIGGSAAPIEAMMDLLCPDYQNTGWNNFSERQRLGLPKIHVLDTTDEVKIKRMIDIVQDPINIIKICVISKSGETLEPDVGFRMLKHALMLCHGQGKDNFNKYVLVITDKAKGALRKEAEENGYNIVGIIPDEIGGRFSAFTAVGMFALALAGADVEKIARGAQDFEEELKNVDADRNIAIKNGYLLAKYAKENMETIIWAYGAERFKGQKTFTEQLQAESLGKKRKSDGVGIGPTPIMVLCNGKIKPAMENLAISQRHFNLSIHITRTRNKELDGILRKDSNQRIKKLQKAGRPVLKIEMPEMNEYFLGQFYQLLMNTIAYAGEFLAVDTFNQPGVQIMKRFVNVILGKTPSEQAKKQLIGILERKRESQGRLQDTTIEQIFKDIGAEIKGHIEAPVLFIDLTNVLERAIGEHGVPETALEKIKKQAEDLPEKLDKDKKQGLADSVCTMAAYFAGILVYLQKQKGKRNIIAWTYAEDFAEFGQRLVNKRAEGLPDSLALAVMSPQGQHSVQQMILEGENKYVNIIIAADKHGVDLSMPDLKDNSYLTGKKLDYIINAEAVCTAAAMTQNNRPNIMILTTDLSSESMEQLEKFFELEIALEKILYES